MKLHRALVTILVALLIVLTSSTDGPGQGTITFNGWAGLSGPYYEEDALQFTLVIPPGTSGRDDMAIILGGGNTPQDGTAFMGWFRQYNPYDYVELDLTNGSTFGLTSVWLADPTAPSLSPVAISFLGSKTDGSTVTNTFTTPGNGATTFQSYQFGSAFASGLSSAQINAPRWAMDNLAFTVPEPSTVALVALGLFCFIKRRRGKHA